MIQTSLLICKLLKGRSLEQVGVIFDALLNTWWKFLPWIPVIYLILSSDISLLRPKCSLCLQDHVISFPVLFPLGPFLLCSLIMECTVYCHHILALSFSNWKTPPYIAALGKLKCLSTCVFINVYLNLFYFFFYPMAHNCTLCKGWAPWNYTQNIVCVDVFLSWNCPLDQGPSQAENHLCDSQLSVSQAPRWPPRC